MLAHMSKRRFGTILNLNTRYKATKTGSILIIAIRRYKNKYDDWPQSLDDVKNLTAATNFIDPFNGGNYVYRLAGDNFILYSKGENGIDENGKEGWISGTENRADDKLIWPNSRKELEKLTENKEPAE